MMPHAARTSLGDPRRIAAVQRAASVAARSEALDRLTELAVRSLHAPMAAVTLLDGAEQLFVSQQGFPQAIARASRTPVAESFCRHVVLRGRPFHTTDATRDPFFFASPLVVEHGMRAYAGVPLLSTEGDVLGAFCVVDVRPRSWSPLDLRALEHMGRLASIELARAAEGADAGPEG